MHDGAQPLGFCWTPWCGMFKGILHSHGREVVTQPGRDRAVQFAAIHIPPTHPFAEDGRYELVCPVYVLANWPGLALEWSQWIEQHRRREIMEVYCMPRTRPQTEDEAAWSKRQSTLAKAVCMTSCRIPAHARWGERKLGEVLAAIGATREEYLDYLVEHEKGE